MENTSKWLGGSTRPAPGRIRYIAAGISPVASGGTEPRMDGMQRANPTPSTARSTPLTRRATRSKH